jgi:hypothetical protein
MQYRAAFIWWTTIKLGDKVDYHLVFEVLSVVVVPFTVWLFNIQKDHDKQIQDLKDDLSKKASDAKLDQLKESRDEDIKNLKLSLSDKVSYTRLDEYKKWANDSYVHLGEYNTANYYKDKSIDDKFVSMLAVNNTQFKNLEDKIDDLKKFIDNKLIISINKET